MGGGVSGGDVSEGFRYEMCPHVCGDGSFRFSAPIFRMRVSGSLIETLYLFPTCVG